MPLFKSHRRKVLIIVENLPVPFDKRVWNEATTLVEHGYQVCIICPKGKDYTASYEFLDGVHIYRHPLPTEGSGAIGYLFEYGTALTFEFLLAVKILFKHGFHAIHACNPPDLIFLIGALFKLLGKRFLFDHHDLNPELYEAKFKKRDGFWKLLCLFEKLTFRLADVVISTNESYKRIAIERGGVKENKVFIVRSNPSLERIKQLPPRPDLKGGKPYLIGYVGVMGDQEGIPYLLEAAQYIRTIKGRDDIRYMLVGGGTSLEALKAQTTEMGLADIVEFTGRAPDQLLLEVLNTADICVNPDEHNPMNDKSTMNKIMEYMALGKPMVQFDLVEGKYSAAESSLYAKPNDSIDLAEKICWLLDNPEERERMGAVGRKRVEEQFSWDKSVPPLLAAYDTLFA
jgi:glycosyltransferase involved in cell wall biosynthesis